MLYDTILAESLHHLMVVLYTVALYNVEKSTSYKDIWYHAMMISIQCCIILPHTTSTLYEVPIYNDNYGLKPWSRVYFCNTLDEFLLKVGKPQSILE